MFASYLMIDKFYYYHHHNKVSLWLNDFDISLDYHSSINLIKVLNKFLDAKLNFEDAQRYLHYENIYLGERKENGKILDADQLNPNNEQYIGVTDYTTSYTPFLKLKWINRFTVDFEIMDDTPEYVQILERIYCHIYRVAGKENTYEGIYFGHYDDFDEVLEKVKYFRDTEMEELIKEQELPVEKLTEFKQNAAFYYPILDEYIKRQKATNYAKL